MGKNTRMTYKSQEFLCDEKLKPTFENTAFFMCSFMLNNLRKVHKYLHHKAICTFFM